MMRITTWQISLDKKCARQPDKKLRALDIPHRKSSLWRGRPSIVVTSEAAQLAQRLAVLGGFHFTQEPADDVERREALALRPEVGEDSVSEHGGSESLNILDRNRVTALQHGACLGAQYQIL